MHKSLIALATRRSNAHLPVLFALERLLRLFDGVQLAVGPAAHLEHLAERALAQPTDHLEALLEIRLVMVGAVERTAQHRTDIRAAARRVLVAAAIAAERDLVRKRAGRQALVAAGVQIVLRIEFRRSLALAKRVAGVVLHDMGKRIEIDMCVNSVYTQRSQQCTPTCLKECDRSLSLKTGTGNMCLDISGRPIDIFYSGSSQRIIYLRIYK